MRTFPRASTDMCSFPCSKHTRSCARRSEGTYLRIRSTDVCKMSRRRHTCAKCHAEGTDLRTLSTDVGTLSRKEKMRATCHAVCVDICTLSRSRHIYMCAISRRRQTCAHCHAIGTDVPKPISTKVIILVCFSRNCTRKRCWLGRPVLIALALGRWNIAASCTLLSVTTWRSRDLSSR